MEATPVTRLSSQCASSFPRAFAGSSSVTAPSIAVPSRRAMPVIGCFPAMAFERPVAIIGVTGVTGVGVGPCCLQAVVGRPWEAEAWTIGLRPPAVIIVILAVLCWQDQPSVVLLLTRLDSLPCFFTITIVVVRWAGRGEEPLIQLVVVAIRQEEVITVVAVARLFITVIPTSLQRLLPSFLLIFIRLSLLIIITIKKVTVLLLGKLEQGVL